MQITLTVKRYDPERARDKSYDQDYLLDVPDHFTVLDALIKVREEVDESLAVRCSCRAAICGSCAMRVNGRAGLGCKTRLLSNADDDGVVRVEPMGNQPVVKDLVVDMSVFWGKIRAVKPYLQPEGPEPEGEYVASNDSMLKLLQTMGCIMCGACVSDCTVLEVNQDFLGPAALAKSYRFVGDPRDDATNQRFAELDEAGGMWDCTRCFECVQACPKGVAPMDQIMKLREEAAAAGFTNTTGARHAEIFAETVKHSGWVDELQLAVKTPGMFNIAAQIHNMPVGIRAFLRGKLPPVVHKAIPDVRFVRRIFEKVEGD